MLDDVAEPRRFRRFGVPGVSAKACPASLCWTVFTKTARITAKLPAQDLGRAKAFYIEKVGLQAVESRFLEASDGRVGLMVGDGVNRLFVHPAFARSPGEFTQAVIQVSDVGAAVEEMRRRGVAFEEYDTTETQTDNGVCSDAGWR